MKKVLFVYRRIIFYFFKVINLIVLELAKVNYDNINIDGIIYIINEGDIYFGKGVRINSSSFKNVIGGDTKTKIIVKKNAELKLGEKVGISNSTIYCTKRIEIGSNVLIGGSCRIWDTDFHSLSAQERIARVNERVISKPIVIKDNVFIGGGSIILRGVVIGENSIIGAGSVVSKEVPPNQIWAGNPARFVRNIPLEVSSQEKT